MKTIKYTFAILFLSTFFIACEAEAVAVDDTIIENVNSTGIDDHAKMDTGIDDHAKM